MKNLLFALQIELDRGNSDSAKTRIAALLGELKRYEQKPYTTVPVIDAMISYKGERLREYGAEFSVSAEPLYVDDPLAYDIASLLAIALDNAGDAALSSALAEGRQGDKPAEPPRFTVRLVISRRKNLVFIQLSNPLARPLVYRNGEPQSTKEEPGHGLGLPALRRIVERRSGEARISDKDGLFSLEVMLIYS
jgi:sensor histidine kinase regulating citrate/malate metabolism